MAESGLATSSVGLPAETTTELASFPAGQPLDDYIHKARVRLEGGANDCARARARTCRGLLEDLELICGQMDEARLYIARFQGQPTVLKRATKVKVITSLVNFHHDYGLVCKTYSLRDLEGGYTPPKPLSWFERIEVNRDFKLMYGWNYPLVVRHDLHSTIEQACFYRPVACRGLYQHVAASRPLRLVRPLSEL